MNITHSESALSSTPNDDVSTPQPKRSTNPKHITDLTITPTFNLDEKKIESSLSDPLSSDHVDANKRNLPIILDDDLTMVEVSDMRIAEELMCNRHLRPPLPIGIPKGKLFLSCFFLFSSSSSSEFG